MKIYWDGKSKNIIGERIKILRTQHNPPLTQKDLAIQLQLLGYQFSELTILRIEGGKRFVPDYEVKMLANFFGVSYDYLIDGKCND